MITFHIIFLILITICASLAQGSEKLLRQGNKAYDKKNYSNAEIFYRRAEETDRRCQKQAIFNIGNAKYKQDKFKEAGNQYSQLAANESLTDNERADVFYNMGNSYLMQKQYRESVEAYKQSLRLRPNNENTRYNLFWAMKMLKNQEPNDNQDKNPDQKKDQLEKQGNNKEKNNKDQNDKKDPFNKKDDQNKEDIQKEPQPKISKQKMDQFLKAISNKDKQALAELREKEMKKTANKPEKDW